MSDRWRLQAEFDVWVYWPSPAGLLFFFSFILRCMQRTDNCSTMEVWLIIPLEPNCLPGLHWKGSEKYSREIIIPNDSKLAGITGKFCHTLRMWEGIVLTETARKQLLSDIPTFMLVELEELEEEQTQAQQQGANSTFWETESGLLFHPNFPPSPLLINTHLWRGMGWKELF